MMWYKCHRDLLIHSKIKGVDTLHNGCDHLSISVLNLSHDDIRFPRFLIHRGPCTIHNVPSCLHLGWCLINFTSDVSDDLSFKVFKAPYIPWPGKLPVHFLLNTLLPYHPVRKHMGLTLATIFLCKYHPTTLKMSDQTHVHFKSTSPYEVGHWFVTLNVCCNHSTNHILCS